VPVSHSNAVVLVDREIARAHDGSLDVTSSPEETRFTFRMPAQSIS